MRTIILALVILLTSGLSFAQERMPGRDSDNHHKMQERQQHPESFGRNLPPPIPDLTKEQEQQLKKNEVEFRKLVLPIENKIGEAEAKLRTESTKDAPDASIMDKLIDEISAHHAAIQKAEMRLRQNIRKLLTEEQRIFFDQQGPRHPDHAKIEAPMPPCPKEM